MHLCHFFCIFHAFSETCYWYFKRSFNKMLLVPHTLLQRQVLLVPQTLLSQGIFGISHRAESNIYMPAHPWRHREEHEIYITAHPWRHRAEHKKYMLAHPWRNNKNELAAGLHKLWTSMTSIETPGASAEAYI